MDSTSGRHDFDWLVIGSGFGGSVAGLRLAEKGYRVGLLECERRYEDADFARSAWDLRRYCWMPRLGMRGVLRLTAFQARLHRLGLGRRLRQPRVREHALPGAARAA